MIAQAFKSAKRKMLGPTPRAMFGFAARTVLGAVFGGAFGAVAGSTGIGRPATCPVIYAIIAGATAGAVSGALSASTRRDRVRCSGLIGALALAKVAVAQGIYADAGFIVLGVSAGASFVLARFANFDKIRL
jgi:hypothetical protein